MKEADPVAMCFTCKVRPAGFSNAASGDYYKHSAYCEKCQPAPKK